MKKEKLKNTACKVVNHFKELATWGRGPSQEKKAVRVIRLLVVVTTTLLSK